MRLVGGVAMVLLLGCGSPPPRPACEPRPAPGVLGTVCGFSNPEDLHVVPSAGIMLVSQMAPLSDGGSGSLAAATLDSLSADQPTVWRIWPPEDGGPPAPPAAGGMAGDPSCTTPPPANHFSPHGLATRGRDGGVDVAVVAHGAREAIELFELTGQGRQATLRWRGCVPMPPDIAGNDVAIRPDGSLVAANCLPAFGGLRGIGWMLASGLGKSTGDVLTWSRDDGWRHLPDTAARTANGVAVSADGRTIWFTETGGRRIGRIDPDGTVTRASLEGSPDNLAWTSRGTLLTALHLSSSAFLRCAFGRRPCRAPWAIVEIDPQTLRATTLVQHDGDALGAVSGAAEWDGRYWLSAVFDDRIGVFASPPQSH